MESSSDDVSEFLSQIREKFGIVRAYPYYFVCGVNVEDALVEVNRDDPFFKKNNIEFLELAGDSGESPIEPITYNVAQAESGSFKHTIN